MRKLFVVTSAALLLAGSVWAQQAVISPAQLALQETLEKRISCDFAEATLAEVVEFLKTALGINIVVFAPFDQSQAPITLSLKNVTASTVLRYATRQAGLQYVLVDGVVYIAAQQDALNLEPTYFKHYEITDVLAPVSNTGTTASAGGTATTGGAAVAGGNVLSLQDAQALVAFIVQCTGPENWTNVAASPTYAPVPNSN